MRLPCGSFAMLARRLVRVGGGFVVSGHIHLDTFGRITSPGRWSALQGPVHLASITVFPCALPCIGGSKVDVLSILYAVSNLPVTTACVVALLPVRPSLHTASTTSLSPLRATLFVSQRS